jgi:hypothetical protein
MNFRPYALSFAGAAAACLGAPLHARAADPTTADCLVASNGAIDLRNDHKLRAARGQLLTCAANSCPSDIRKECLRKVDEINAQIPTVIFEAKDASTGRDLSAVKVTLDGQPLVARLEGAALSVDPGLHTFTFETEGQAPVTKQLVILEAQKDRRETIVFGTPPPSESCPPGAKLDAASGLCVRPPCPPGSTRDPASGVCIAPRPGLGTQRVFALATAAVGVAGLATGSAFGAVALSQKRDAQSVCPNVCSNESGVQKWSSATTSGNFATAFFVVGAVGAVGGAVLWLTAKPAESSGATAAMVVSPTSLQLRGTW